MAKRKRAFARGKPASRKRVGGRKATRKTDCKRNECAPLRIVSRAIGRNVPHTRSISNIANANQPRSVVFTREALAHARHQYEHTPLSLARIAVDLGIHRKTFRSLARSQAWVRYVRPPRGLLPAVQLNARASELEAQAFDASMPATPSSENTDAVRRGEGTGPKSASPVLPQLADTLDRLYRAVMEELVAVETLRAQVKREPQSPQDAERTARTLSSLTETLQKLQRLQCAVPQSGSHNDDIPADIDEFRTELARRIEAFVASRSDPGDNGGSTAAPVDAAAG